MTIIERDTEAYLCMLVRLQCTRRDTAHSGNPGPGPVHRGHRENMAAPRRSLPVCPPWCRSSPLPGGRWLFAVGG